MRPWYYASLLPASQLMGRYGDILLDEEHHHCGDAEVGEPLDQGRIFPIMSGNTHHSEGEERDPEARKEIGLRRCGRNRHAEG